LILEIEHRDAKLSTDDLLGAINVIYGINRTPAKEEELKQVQ
jgi:hypothetical protein